MSDVARTPEPTDDEPRPREEAFERVDDPDTPNDPRRSTGTGRRAGSRIALGFVIGPIAGAVLGLIVGSLVFGTGSRGFWAAVIAGAVFGALGGFWGGLSALGPPEVENDPLPADEGSRGAPGSTTTG